jgi:uncharacterized protein (TIGR03435 family)
MDLFSLMPGARRNRGGCPKGTIRYALALIALTVEMTSAQTPTTSTKPEFEVASIRVAVPDGNHDSDSYKGRFTTHNVTLRQLVAMAYDVDAALVGGGPGWADADGYDINAKIPEELAVRTQEKFGQMLQNLLMERFQLMVHQEPRQISGYELVLARQPPKMAVSQLSDAGSDITTHNAHLTAKYVTMEQFARRLSRDRDIAKPVADRTGLKDKFDFDLVWAPAQISSRADEPSDDHPSIFTALQEQLGLKLVPARISTLVVVIDRAERPDAN